jgi:hypothetical protein
MARIIAWVVFMDNVYWCFIQQEWNYLLYWRDDSSEETLSPLISMTYYAAILFYFSIRRLLILLRWILLTINCRPHYREYEAMPSI